jgi:hypothetical protein
MKYCQGPQCHTYRTKDRIRGPKGFKQYETRRRTSFYYGKGNFCDQRCMYNWIDMHIERALDHYGRTTEPKHVMADSAWYKDYKYNYNNGNDSTYSHYFVNDLLGQRISITQQQYDDQNLVRPS